MVKRLFFSLIVIILLLQAISAINTEIKVKTIPNHEVQITILKSATDSSVLQSFKNNSNEYGDVSFIYSSDGSKFGLIVFIKKDGDKVIWEKFTENYNVGESVYIELAPDWFEFIATPDKITEINETNETLEALEENETLDIINDSVVTEDLVGEKQDSKLFGYAIFEGGKFSLKKGVYYGFGIIILLIGFAALLIIRTRLKAPQKEIRIKKLSELNAERQEQIENDDERIQEAEKKIKEAQEEINKIKESKESAKIKNKEKIEQVKKKLIEDEKELIRLRRGEE